MLPLLRVHRAGCFSHFSIHFWALSTSRAFTRTTFSLCAGSSAEPSSSSTPPSWHWSSARFSSSTSKTKMITRPSMTNKITVFHEFPIELLYLQETPKNMICEWEISEEERDHKKEERTAHILGSFQQYRREGKENLGGGI